MRMGWWGGMVEGMRASGGTVVVWGLVSLLLLSAFGGPQAHEHESHSGPWQECILCTAVQMPAAPAAEQVQAAGEPPALISFQPSPPPEARLELLDPAALGARGPPVHAF